MIYTRVGDQDGNLLDYTAKKSEPVLFDCGDRRYT